MPDMLDTPTIVAEYPWKLPYKNKVRNTRQLRNYRMDVLAHHFVIY